MHTIRFQPVPYRFCQPAGGWQKHAQSLLGALPEFLTWQGGSEFVNGVCEIHESVIHSRLALWSQAGGNYLETFMELPGKGQERLFHAPQFLLLLRSKSAPGPDEAAKYQNFIEAEEYLCGRKNSPPAGYWTALGDRYFRSKTDCQPDQAANPLRSGLFVSAPFARGILIDAWSPYLTQSWIMPAGSGQMEIYYAEDVSRIEKRVAEALEYIASVSPSLIRTICAAMHVIGTAKASAAPDMVVSASARRMIGSCALSNLHSSAWRLGDICDAIIHETIHALLYRLELIRPFYGNLTAWLEGRAESPWSGRSLELHSLVHACFVWFGLWNFWTAYPHQLTEAIDLRNRASAGFLRAPASSLLPTELYASIQPEVRSAIAEMFDRVRSAALA
jgi:hypothetical protein